jgi:cyanate lyase
VTKAQASELIQAAMRARDVTFAQIAAAMERPAAWTAAAIFGQHPFTEDDVAKLYTLLPNLEPDLRDTLTAIPSRGALDAPVPTDPTIYRLYEVLLVYGPALKALIHEEFGDGIMSAINFKLDVQRVPDPGGDRVEITLNGKFLPYQWG